MSDPTKPLWTTYTLQLTFYTPLYGSVPADPNLVEKWLESRQPHVKPAGARSMDEITAEAVETLLAPEEDLAPRGLVFQRRPGNGDRPLVVRGDTIRAHPKDCARVLSAQFYPKVKGERAFSTRVANGLYLDLSAHYWVPILRDGVPLTEADERIDRAIHVWTPQGQRNGLKVIERVFDASITCRLKVMTESIHASDLHNLLDYGGIHGYGGERSLDGGKYTYHLHTEGEGT